MRQLEVKVFRNQDWCQCFQYKGGAFMQSTHESTCGLFKEKALPFSQQALTDFQAVEEALSRCRVPIHYLVVDPHSIEFNLAGWSRESLIYQPGYNKLPADQGGEARYLKVDDDFYRCLEDWN